MIESGTRLESVPKRYQSLEFSHHRSLYTGKRKTKFLTSRYAEVTSTPAFLFSLFSCRSEVRWRSKPDIPIAQECLHSERSWAVVRLKTHLVAASFSFTPTFPRNKLRHSPRFRGPCPNLKSSVYCRVIFTLQHLQVSHLLTVARHNLSFGSCAFRILAPIPNAPWFYSETGTI